jgi:hypothetical protein
MGKTTRKSGKAAGTGRVGDTRLKRIRDISNITLVAAIMTMYLSAIVTAMFFSI